MPPYLKAKAKALYFEYRSIGSIKEDTGISAATIHHWVHGYRARADRQDMPVEKTWKYQRQKREEELVAELADANKRELHRIYKASLPLIADSLEALKNSTLDLKDTVLVAEIITKVDKLFRLSAEKPTEILGISNLSLQDMRNAIEGDFFRRQPKQVKEIGDNHGATIEGAGPERADDGIGSSADPFPEVRTQCDGPQELRAGDKALSALGSSGEDGAGVEQAGDAPSTVGE